MANKNTYSSSVGAGFFGALTLLFIALKLTGYITWGWLWVVSPIWLYYLFAIVFVFIILAIVGSFGIILLWFTDKK